jgi:hypothetical protein
MSFWAQLGNTQPYIAEGAPGHKSAADDTAPPAQAAPPLIPSTAEQQQYASAKEQYGGARAGLDSQDKSALIVLGLAIGGGLLWMRSKGQ